MNGIHQCEKMLELTKHPKFHPEGGQERCFNPTLANNSHCWEHQPQPDGKRQTRAWTAEQVEHALEFSDVVIVDDRIVEQAAKRVNEEGPPGATQSRAHRHERQDERTI